MATQHRCLMFGAGGMAGNWLRRFLPVHGERVRVVGLVEVVPGVLHTAADQLGLPAAARFADMDSAYRAIDAGHLEVDCVMVAVPPRFHRPAVEAAAERGLAILSEKPIADTWEDVRSIYQTVTRCQARMQVMQNYRYTSRIQTIKGVIDSGRIGRPHYIVSRFAADYRKRLAWGAEFRHEMRHPLLIEGAIHHFDQIRHLSGADCVVIAGWEWLPESGGASFKGECVAQYVVRLADGSSASYEGNGLAGGWQNSWRGEYYRVECEGGAVVLDRDNMVRIQEWTPGQGLCTTEVPPVPMALEEHPAVIGQFLDWLDGGAAPATVLSDNIKSAAMLFAAIEASAEQRVVDVAAMVRALVE